MIWFGVLAAVLGALGGNIQRLTQNHPLRSGGLGQRQSQVCPHLGRQAGNRL